MSAAPPQPPPQSSAAAAAAAAASAGEAELAPAAATAAAAHDGGGARMVAVPAELLARIIKKVDLLAEAVRREDELAKRCRGCKGEADYLIAYGGAYKGRTARVCERCMEETVVHKHGMDIYTWKHDAAKISCARCGDDVTKRGWCVCPRNASLGGGKGGTGDGRSAGRMQQEDGA